MVHARLACCVSRQVMRRNPSLGHSTLIARFSSSSISAEGQKTASTDQNTASGDEGKEARSQSSKNDSMVAENERIRQLLLDRDGGSASVPTREGGWDQEMGRETSRQMHRVLDQTRINKPGTSNSVGQGESKSFRNGR